MHCVHVGAVYPNREIRPSIAKGHGIGPPRGTVFTTPLFKRALPPIEAVAASALAPANGEANDPKNKKDRRRYPQKVHSKSRSEENQDKQQAQESIPLNNLPICDAPKFVVC